MSKVRIQGNATGTGIFTVAAPATNTDRTITLPDTSSTLLAPDSTGSIQLDFAGSNNYLRFISSANYVGRNSSTGDIWLNAQGGQSVILGINGTSQLKVDGNGRVTMPNQPAFYAMMNNTNITSTAAIVFEDVYVNRGSCYNPANGRFTAPIDGTYHFSANFLKRGGSGRLLFHRNDVYYGSGNSQTYSGSVGSGEIPHAASIIITLVAGDYINVIAQIDSGDVYGNSNSHNAFSGFLIG